MQKKLATHQNKNYVKSLVKRLISALEDAQLAARDLLGGTEMFDEIQLSDGRMLGDHPDIVKMFSNLATQIGEDNLAGFNNRADYDTRRSSRQIADMTRRWRHIGINAPRA